MLAPGRVASVVITGCDLRLGMVEVCFQGVSKRYAGRVVLSDVDLTIPSGALVALVGPSGSGKSSLLRMICGLDRPDEGTVTVGGRPVVATTGPPTGVAMVFQNDALYDHFDVAANLRFPLQVSGADVDHTDQVSKASARWAGITRLWRRSPRTLSGGERSMVATGRAISRDGLEVLLLDEPLAGADRQVRQRFRRELRLLHQRGGMTTVVATNDEQEAMALGDLLVVVIGGGIAQIGSPRTVFESPDTTTVASFLGSPPMNLFPGTVVVEDGLVAVDVGGDRVVIESPALGLTAGTRVVVGLHAHELVIAPPGTPFGRMIHGTASRIEDLGSRINILFGLGRSAAGTFVMTENRPAALRPG
ncbi:MAG: ABC transporter ATP-binding protein, partial [Acidimicrobiia bacterium]